MLAQMQGQYAMQNLMGVDGLYLDSDSTLDYTANWVMLHALSDIAGLTREGRYMNPEAHPMFEDAATGLFRVLERREPESAKEAAAAIRALIYRASTAGDASVGSAAVARAKAIAAEHLLNFFSRDVIENAAAMVGLTAVAAAEDNPKYRDAAERLFQALVPDFDWTHGVFKSKGVYNVDDVAWIVSGLNFLVLQGNKTSRDEAARMSLAFYESTISLAGLQLSAPLGKNGAMAGEWEKGLPSVLFYHPANTPPPPMVGKLPVFAEEVSWDGTGWTITSDRFVPAGAMHLANELNWQATPLGSVPFPLVEGLTTAAANPSERVGAR